MEILDKINKLCEVLSSNIIPLACSQQTHLDKPTFSTTIQQLHMRRNVKNYIYLYKTYQFKLCMSRTYVKILKELRTY